MVTTPAASADRRIVVGVDGSAAAREALHWACRLAGLRRAEIVAVHALGLVEPLGVELVPAHRHRAEIERIMADEWCAALRRDGRAVQVVVEEGYPVDVLTQVAQLEGAEIVVVGSRGIGAAPARALGSTSLHLLQVASCAVLVVPDPEHAGPRVGLQRILVAVDSAAPTSGAVVLAGQLAAASAAAVTVVHAVEEVPVFPLGPATEVSSEGEVDAPVRDRARLEPIRRLFRGLGLGVELRVERGRAPDVVASTATAIDADLVVLGSAASTTAADPLVGSVSRSVVARLDRPALVVPEGSLRAPSSGVRGARYALQ